MSTESRIVEDLEQAAEDMVRLALAAPSRIATIRDRMAGQPSAMSLDSSGSGSVNEDGTPGSPTVTAALAVDAARADLARFSSLARSLRAQSDALVDLLRAYDTRSATPSERQQADRENWPSCESCARTEIARGVMRKEPAHGTKRINPAQKLPREYHLCRWCGDFARTHERLPTTLEVTDHHDGKRVRVHETPKRWKAPEQWQPSAEDRRNDRRDQRTKRLGNVASDGTTAFGWKEPA